MSDSSTIEWTDATWNPIRGCTCVSPGCARCYAQLMAARFSGPGRPFAGFATRNANGEPRWTGKVELIPEKLFDPLHWRKPRRIFVNSMSDLFHEALPLRAIQVVFEVMRAADWHTYQVLTKRSNRMREALFDPRSEIGPSRHIWLGVSIEDRKHGLPRIDALRETPAGVRFLSVEPLLEDLGPLDLRDIDWVIVGGESGPGARPMKPEWVRAIRDQCKERRVPFFFKQWGGPHKHVTGRMLDGEVYDEFPPTIRSAPPSPRDKDARLQDLALRLAAFEMHGESP